MKKFLFSLTSLTLLLSTSIAAFNTTNELTRNLTTLNSVVKRGTSISIENQEPDGKNLIKVEDNLLFLHNHIYVNSQTLENWKEFASNFKQLEEKILADILKFRTEGKKSSIKYEKDAFTLGVHFQYLLKTPGSSLYGIIAEFDSIGTPDLRLVSLKPQFSSNLRNSSYTQEKFSLFGDNQLIIYISIKQWENIFNSDRTKKSIAKILKLFPQDCSWNKFFISNKSLEIMAEYISDNFNYINLLFKESKTLGRGWVIKTNSICQYQGCYIE